MLTAVEVGPSMETVTPSGKNFVNANDSYKRCEEKRDGNWNGRPVGIESWLLRDIHVYSITILLPVFLAVCFLISILGIVFLFTSFFLVSKLNVMEVFINDCNSSIIILIFITNSIHLLTTGLTGVLGLGRRRWLLVMHTLLVMGALFTMMVTYYYEPRYESIVLEETDACMWSSLVKNRYKYHSGWDYIQRNMQCCGVNGYGDWCGCSNRSSDFAFRVQQPSKTNQKDDKNRSCSRRESEQLDSWTKTSSPVYLDKGYREEDFIIIKSVDNHSSSEINVNKNYGNKFSNNYEIGKNSSNQSIISSDEIFKAVTESNDKEKKILLFLQEKLSENYSTQSFYIKNKNIVNQSLSGKAVLEPENEFFLKKEVSSLNDLKRNQLIIECFISDSCCSVKDNFEYDSPEGTCLKDNAIINNRGCLSPIKHMMKRFLKNFISICKFIILVMILDVPLALLMIST